MILLCILWFLAPIAAVKVAVSSNKLKRKSDLISGNNDKKKINNFYYSLNKLTDENVLHLDYSLFNDFLVKKKANSKNKNLLIKSLSLCMHHKNLGDKIAACCKDFLSYRKSIVINFSNNKFILPPPYLWKDINTSYFIKMIRLMNDKDIDNSRLEKIKNCYVQILNKPIKIGHIESLKSKKTSLIRNNILAIRGNALRLTLVMDMELSPHNVAISSFLYNKLDLAMNLVLLNRAPSINSTCVYVCQLLTFENDEDMTLHINPWIAEGLHADADGDELPMYYVKREGTLPTYDMQRAIVEMKNLTWKYGMRTNFLNMPRYSFPQHFKYLTYIHNEFLIRENTFYRVMKELYGNLSHSECLKKMMTLGCTIMREEFDNFLELLLALQKAHPCTGFSFYKFENGLTDIVESGAKGTHNHITVLKECLSIKKDGPLMENKKYHEKLIDSFNNYVNKGNEIKQEGMVQFKYLQGFSNIIYNNDHIMSNNHLLVENVSDFSPFNMFLINPVCFDFLFTKLESEVLDEADGYVDKYFDEDLQKIVKMAEEMNIG